MLCSLFVEYASALGELNARMYIRDVRWWAERAFKDRGRAAGWSCGDRQTRRRIKKGVECELGEVLRFRTIL